MQLHEVLLGEFYFVSCTSNVMSALYEVLCEVTISVFQGTASVYNMYGLNRCHQYRFCRLHGTRCISAINNVIIEVCRWKRIQYMLIHAWRINSDGLSVLCLKKKKKVRTYKIFFSLCVVQKLRKATCFGHVCPPETLRLSETHFRDTGDCMKIC